MRLQVRLMVLIVIAVALLAVGCSIAAETEDVALSPGFAASEATALPASPSPIATPLPPPTPRPMPTGTPTPSPEPTAAVSPDSSQVVVQGNGWVTTQDDVDEMVAFIEDTHELEFLGDVGVAVDPDIGASFAAGFEPIDEDSWTLLTTLGLTAEGIDRNRANQVRLDRIRGVCCGVDGGVTEVIVEIQSTKLATDIIIVHELTHALHQQHQVFVRDRQPSPEPMRPEAAAFEGVPSFVALRWLALGSQAEQELVIPDLPIIPEGIVNLTGPAAARYLNFAYDTGPSFVEAVVADRGLAGLSEVIEAPPRTAEQVLFPQRYLSDEPALAVERPDVPAGTQIDSQGTIGAAVLMFLLTDAVGADAALDHVSNWSGDRYVTYIDGDQICLRATIELDTADAASTIADPLRDRLTASFTESAVVVEDVSVSLSTCSAETR